MWGYCGVAEGRDEEYHHCQVSWAYVLKGQGRDFVMGFNFVHGSQWEKRPEERSAQEVQY